MKDFFLRLTSRKFLLTVAASLTFYANGQYTELAGTIITYLVAEGGADVVGRYTAGKYTAPKSIQYKTQLLDAGINPETGHEEPRTIVPGSSN